MALTDLLDKRPRGFFCRTTRCVALTSTSLIALVGAVLFSVVDAAPNDALQVVEEGVQKRFSDVHHVGPDTFAAKFAGGNGGGEKRTASTSSMQPVLLDIRRADEFAVSHLPDAIRIDPQASAETILKTVGDLTGRTVIVYCSVGVRSSQLAQRVQRTLEAKGATRVVNLEGGIFRWHNEGRGLVRGSLKTDLVHPYDAFWGRLIDCRDKIAYSPKPD